MTFVTAEPYIGHLGLDGVGDTKGLLESEMRQHHVKWITNAKVKKVDPGRMIVEELNDDGTLRQTHELPFAYSMMLPPFAASRPFAVSRVWSTRAASSSSTNTSAIQPIGTSSASACASLFRPLGRRRCRSACPKPDS